MVLMALMLLLLLMMNGNKGRGATTHPSSSSSTTLHDAAGGTRCHGTTLMSMTQTTARHGEGTRAHHRHIYGVVAVAIRMVVWLLMWRRLNMPHEVIAMIIACCWMIRTSSTIIGNGNTNIHISHPLVGCHGRRERNWSMRRDWCAGKTFSSSSSSSTRRRRLPRWRQWPQLVVVAVAIARLHQPLLQ
jgi:hypothetical protein